MTLGKCWPNVINDSEESIDACTCVQQTLKTQKQTVVKRIQ